MTDFFSTPDGYAREITASDIYWVEKARVITDAHTFLVPLIWLGVALFFYLGMRRLAGNGPGRIRRLIGLWLAAKERELSERKVQ